MDTLRLVGHGFPFGPLGGVDPAPQFLERRVGHIDTKRADVHAVVGESELGGGDSHSGDLDELTAFRAKLSKIIIRGPDAS
jgi:hypothetical protein